MKNRLLAAMALCCATSMSAWAGNWEKPSLTFVDPDLTIPSGEIPTTGLFPYIQDLGSYYIYHVATEKFMTNSGTALNVGPKGQIITLGYGYDREALAEDPAYNYLGWILSMPDAPSNCAVADFHEIFADNGNYTGLWVDGNGKHMLWQFKKQDNGTYMIAAIDEDDGLGVNSERAGSVWGRSPSTAEDQTTSIVASANKDSNPLVETEWKFVSLDAYEIYQAKITLYDALNKAEAGGMNVDAFAAIYNKDGVTVEELGKACTDLESAYADFLGSTASPENPEDFTSRFVKNADGSSLDGWTTEGACKVTANGEHWSAVDANTANPKNPFLEPCDWGATGFKASIKQTLTGMPNGLYRLTAAGRAELDTKFTLIFNDKKVDFPSVGSYGGTIDLNGKEWPSMEEGKAAGAEFGRSGEGYGWNYASIELTVTDGTLVIGCESSTTKVHQWCSLDDIQLLYMGAADLTYIKEQLQSQIETAESTKAGYDANNSTYSLAGSEAFDKDIAAAKALLDNAEATEEELLSMVDLVKARMSTLANDVRVYGLMEDKFSELDDMLLEIEGVDPENFNNYYDELYDAVENHTFDPAEYDGITAKAQELLAIDFRTALLNGATNDVTPLIVNADFSNGATGWSGNPAIGYGVGEIYNVPSFDVYQVIEGLPAGTYEISADGFYRPGWRDECAKQYKVEGSTYNDIHSYLYGNNSMAPLAHIFEYKLTDITDVPGSWPQISNENYPEINGVYVSDNLQATDYIFNTVGDRPKTTVKCVVGEDGTLRFGVKKSTATNQDGNWTPFDNFKITYLGETIEGFITPLENALKAAGDLYASEALKATQDANKLQSLKVKYEMEMGSYTEVAQYTDAIAKLNDQTERVQKGVDLIKDAYSMASSYLDNFDYALYEDYDEALSSALYDACDEVTVKYDDKLFETLEDVEAAKDAVSKAYSAMILSNVTGSVEKPADVTMLLRSPGFEDATGAKSQDGWTVESNGGAANLVAPDVEGTLYPFFEYYDNNTFNISQTLSYMKAGWYVLDVQGYYRAGGNDAVMTARRDSTDERNVYLYATLADGSVVEKPISSIFETIVIGTKKVDATPGCHSSDVVINKKFYREDDEPLYRYIPNSVNGAALRFKVLDMCHNQIAFEVKEDLQSVVIGLKKDKHLGGDWCAFDNFKLYYTGNDKPAVSVESVDAATADVVSTAYYTIGGIRIAEPAQSGLYIRVDLLSDGTKKVTKMMVK